MTCSFCNKSASKQYYLCDCCFVNLERCNGTTKNLFHTQEKSVPVVPSEEDVGVQKIEGDSYLGRFQEEELLQHRKMCTTSLVFRCAVCHQDYMSKEGLWNHLNLHEVAEENKQMECTEVQVAYSLLKCVLCNDQRGYRERLYWQHVHEDHDGFFLQCSECEDCFRSYKLLTDHVLNHCNARKQAVLSISNDTITDQNHADSQFSEFSHHDSNRSHIEDNDKGEQDLNKLLINTAVEEISQPFLEKMSSATKCPHCGKKFFDKTLLAHHIKYRHSPTRSEYQTHLSKHLEGKCPHCGKTFFDKTLLAHHIKYRHSPTRSEYRHHLSKHLEGRKRPSEIRQTHDTATILPDLDGCREREEHQQQGPDGNMLQDQYEFVTVKEEISVEEPTLLEQEYNVDDTDASIASSSAIIHCPICGGTFGNKDENHLDVHVKLIHQLSICTICGIVCSTDDQLKVHKNQQHGASRFNRDSSRQSVSNTELIETIKPVGSHYVSPFVEVLELNPSYLADEDVLNCSSSDGWEVYSTVPVNELESYLLSFEFGFRFKSQNIPSKGKKRYYDCRRIKCRVVPQCERKLLVFLPNSDADATISVKGKHTCGNAPRKNLTRAKLNEMDCELITNLVKSGVSSRDVKKHIRAVKGIVSDNQLRYAVQSARKTIRK